MYIVENLKTLAEINNTVEANTIPIGSIINVKIIGVVLSENKVHSKRIDLVKKTTIKDGIRNEKKISHTMRLAKEIS
jgi:hypothetical protein